MTCLRWWFTVIALFTLPVLGMALPLPDGSSVTVKETVLLTLPDGNKDAVEDIVFSDDYSQCAAIMRTPEMRGYLYDHGKKSPTYDWLVTYNAGKHLCYEAANGEKMYLAVDGTVIPWCDQVVANPDGARLAYLFHLNGKYCVKVDGKKGPAFDRIELLDWMPDGRLRYLGYRGGQAIFMRNHETLAIIPPQGFNPKMSPDGRRIAYIEKQDDDHYLLKVDDKRFGPFGYEKIQDLHFSADSQRYAAVIAQGDGEDTRYQLLVDGVLGPAYHSIIQGITATDPNNTYYFSPDSKHIAYTAQLTPDNWVMVVDGVASETSYHDLSHPIFSPDSRHIACTAEVKDGDSVTWCVLIDGKEQRRFAHDISGLSFSPDFQRWYVDRVVECQDGTQDWSILTSEGKEYTHIDSSSERYTADSCHLAYLKNNGEDEESDAYRVAIYIDGTRVSAEYPGGVSCLRTTPDGGIQAIFLKTIRPEHGKPYQAVVRADISFTPVQ